MAEANDSSGNSIAFPDGMNDEDRRALLLEIDALRRNFNCLHEVEKPAIWNLIKAMVMGYGAETDYFPNPIGNSENSFEAVLVSTLKLNENRRTRLLASLNEYVSGLLV